MRLEDLVNRVPPEVENRVNKTRQRLNPLVRAILREETALRLNFSSGSDVQEGNGREIVSVPISVLPGAPADACDEVPIDDIDALAILLGQHRGTLEALAHSSEGAEGLAKVLASRVPGCGVPSPTVELQRCKAWARTLLERLAKADPLKKILSFREDILGRYVFRLPMDSDHLFRPERDPFRGEIELYWGVIGLVAELLNCTSEDLTVVVLAHELAHAYTHIGADIDGVRWASRAFSQSETALKEGLAQYYTWRVCERLRDRLPNCLKAFQDMLPRQPDAYRAQEKWIKEKSSPEHVRLAMIQARRHGVKALAGFSGLLTKAREGLGNQGDSPNKNDT